MLRPTRIYVKPVTSLLSSNYGQKAVRGIAHVTGGAFYNKITKILPKGLGFAVNRKSWRPNKIFNKIEKKGKLGPAQMYSVFNMGIGLVVVVKKGSAKRILNRLNKSYKSYMIGEVIKSDKKFILN